MKKWMACITVVLALLFFSVPALAAEAAAPEKGGRKGGGVPASGKLPGSGQMVDKIGSRRESIRHPGTDRLSGTVEGGAGQGKQACLLAGAGGKDFRRMRVS